jgi:hypothetical protein
VRVITSSFLDKRSTLKSPMTICGMPGVKSSRDDLAHHRNISLVDLVVCKY